MADLAATSEKGIVVSNSGAFDLYLDKGKFEQVWRVGNLFAKSDLVPPHYRGHPENCILAFNIATRLDIDPIMFMQKSCIIQGRPGMEAQLVIALVNVRGPFKGPIQWTMKGEGNSRECTSYAIHKVTGERCEATVTWKMVELEGWSKKAGSKWMTIPEMMFRYRSAVFLTRLYCPEVILGFETTDEIEDTLDRRRPAANVSALEERLEPKHVESTVVPQDTETPTDALEAPQIRFDTELPIGAEDVPNASPAVSCEAESFQECRFLCKECGFEADEFAKAVNKGKFIGWKCIKCFSLDVLDRRPQK